ncbi:hypothetical protein GGH19_005335 [Coemansia sp. RSA 1807]|nr:hypothetical protein IWW35_003565 [Coemansia sp. RSA 1878]KAJ2569444.1 hypothetical protein GGH19_005335 [Coemansia sp. RSA 1807]
MELIKRSSGVNLVDDHNCREDPAMLMVKDLEAYYGPDRHVRVVAGNVVDDMRKHNSVGIEKERSMVLYFNIRTKSVRCHIPS